MSKNFLVVAKVESVYIYDKHYYPKVVVKLDLGFGVHRYFATGETSAKVLTTEFNKATDFVRTMEKLCGMAVIVEYDYIGDLVESIRPLGVLGNWYYRSKPEKKTLLKSFLERVLNLFKKQD